MKQQTAIRLAVLAGMAALVTAGFFGYRLLSHGNQAIGTLPPGLAASRSLSPEEAQAAADAIFALSLPDLEGHQRALSEWRGKVLVVNYWASWCRPCVEEMPIFSRLNSHYAAWGVQFVGIGLDEAEKMQAFVETTPVSYPLLVAGTGSTIPALQVKGLPYTVVIDRAGRLDFTRLGRLDEAALEPVLRRLIGH
jgi:peroxiredoxin